MPGRSSVPNDFWDYHAEHLPGAASALYCYLLRLVNSEGLCWPSIAKMQKQINASRNTVRAYLDLLIDRGLIVLEGSQKYQSGYSYRIVELGEGGQPLTPTGSTSTPVKRRRGGQPVPRSKAKTGSTIDPPPGQPLTPTGSTIDPNSYIKTQTHKTQEVPTTTYSREDEIEKQAWALLRQWESALFQTHGGCVTEKAKAAYLDFLKAHIANGSPPTIEQLNLAAEKALAWWQQTGSAGRNSSPGFVLTELKAILYPAPENQNGTSTNGNGRGTSNGHSARPRNGRGPVDYEAQSIADQRRKDQWVIQKYGVSRANDIDVREAVAREAAWEARERSASGAVPGATV